MRSANASSSSKKHKFILRCSLSPGDIVVLSALVRDVHACFPGIVVTDVRTPCPELFQNNPYITSIDEADPEVQIIDCEYPLIHRSNAQPYHFIHGFMQHFTEVTGLDVRPSRFSGDVHVSEEEKAWMSQVQEILGYDAAFWVIVAGGKYDYTTKWWPAEYYQAVVDRFKDRILFVQVGEAGHHHPRLNNVIDLRAKTTLRQLIRLIYHSVGVLCPITLCMHLAAAVPTREGRPRNRACVVIGGGREPSHWEAYPHHQYIHTNGALFCCDNGGCWKSRVLPLGDGSENDNPDNLCLLPEEGFGKCMRMITPALVCDRIDMYYRGGLLQRETNAKNT